MKSIAIVVDYFGKLPAWFQLYLESCRENPTINWIIHTDCTDPYDIPANVTISYISYTDYQQMVKEKLLTDFWPRNTYKICDLKPMYGFLWKDELRNYDFFGFGDIDLIYGNIRSFYTDQILDSYDILSTHSWGLSGPLCLLRNQPWAVNAFARIPHWRDLIAITDCVRFDEDFFWKAFTGPDGKYYERIYLKEQYITPLVHHLWKGIPGIMHDDKWVWKDGKITSPNNGDREFICMHFMNYVSARFMDPSYGEIAPWKTIDKLIDVDMDNISNGFSIGLDGFRSL